MRQAPAFSGRGSALFSSLRMDVGRAFAPFSFVFAERWVRFHAVFVRVCGDGGRVSPYFRSCLRNGERGSALFSSLRMDVGRAFALFPRVFAERWARFVPFPFCVRASLPVCFSNFTCRKENPA